jgi:hypothetical protein
MFGELALSIDVARDTFHPQRGKFAPHGTPAGSELQEPSALVSQAAQDAAAHAGKASDLQFFYWTCLKNNLRCVCASRPASGLASRNLGNIKSQPKRGAITVYHDLMEVHAQEVEVLAKKRSESLWIFNVLNHGVSSLTFDIRGALLRVPLDGWVRLGFYHFLPLRLSFAIAIITRKLTLEKQQTLSQQKFLLGV